MKLELNKVYKDRSGEQWKVFLIDIDNATNYTLLITNKEKNKNRLVDPCGSWGAFFSSKDLIELVGDDFIEEKKPREFKFEAYLAEYTGFPHRTYAIDNALNKDCSALYSNRECIGERNNISKWQVTMKEIIE